MKRDACCENPRTMAASQKIEAVSRLSSGIAHDFNNLLMIVLGNLKASAPHQGATRLASKSAAYHIQCAARCPSGGALTSSFSPSRGARLSIRDRSISTSPSRCRRDSCKKLRRERRRSAVDSAGLWQIEADPTYLETALLNTRSLRDAMPAAAKLPSGRRTFSPT